VNAGHVIPCFAIQERAVCENPDAGPDGIGVQADIAYTLEARQQVQAVAFGGNRTSGSIDTAAALNAKGGSGRMDFETETLIAFDCKAGANTGFAIGDIPGALRGDGHGGGHNAVAFALRGREGGAMPELEGDTAGALRAASGGSSRSYVAFHDPIPFDPRQIGHPANFSNPKAGDPSHPLRAVGNAEPAIAGQFGVRRLLPVECEKLQGFEPNYTRIPWRGKPASECPDGPRYKCLGNSFAVPVIRWIGKRIEQAEACCAKAPRETLLVDT
jgi:DNA (cytosine-5)-methyltransferase 1